MRRDRDWIPKPGTVLDGRYRLDKMVDRGGMGVIMRGQHIRMKREVAVKLLSPDIASEAGYRARFQREVDLAATLEHPNIVRCYDFGETDEGILYLVMEMLDGASLKKVIEEEGRFGLRRAAKIAQQLLDGLAAAHLRDVVHRDLKPGNVFIVKDLRGNEVVKVLDFGLAKSLSSDNIRITKTGAICGTASYLAPESLVTQESTKSGDVYACGLIMLEMLLGRKVYASWSMAQTFIQQLMVPARIPRRVWDTPFGRLMERMLQKHPHDRPADAETVFQELVDFIDDLPDLRLEEEELPPPPGDDLADDLLHLLAQGQYQDLETLRHLPAPESWESEAVVPDHHTTERMLLSELKDYVDAQRRTGRFEDQATLQERPAVTPELAKPPVRFDEQPTLDARPAVTPRIGKQELPRTEQETVQLGAVPKKLVSLSPQASTETPTVPARPRVIVEPSLESTEPAPSLSAPLAAATSAASSAQRLAAKPEKAHFPFPLVVAGVSVGVALGLLGIWAFGTSAPSPESTSVVAPASPTASPTPDDNAKLKEEVVEGMSSSIVEPDPVEEEPEVVEPAPTIATRRTRKPNRPKKAEKPKPAEEPEQGAEMDKHLEGLMEEAAPKKFEPKKSNDDKAEKILDDVLRLPEPKRGD